MKYERYDQQSGKQASEGSAFVGHSDGCCFAAGYFLHSEQLLAPLETCTVRAEAQCPGAVHVQRGVHFRAARALDLGMAVPGVDVPLRARLERDDRASIGERGSSGPFRFAFRSHRQCPW